ncbi:FAD/NAD(P)-binding domain-containing protein [Gonapodya prolifera JEL478]|uniref:FAD/NAD(P)-binding domain-containing protein n=1 Tax=Gonapodya prolifera (strain JEL478) TaxID=1344416 RepID=A0A139AIA1_GONPJ|nr:FAD/NAD(P)-binding domain-containing protein [Gonapodya prolifera JEL478]|eukprot:KXS16541.1 FAD/NAD(P)-binding domain-containing protein [Gonapodya prolifera JEL478]
MPTKTAIMIGGGPAGALAALVLKKHGYDATIYEKRGDIPNPNPEEGVHPFWDVGGAVDLQLNAMYGLERLGLVDEVILNSSGHASKVSYALMDGSDAAYMEIVPTKPGQKLASVILRSSLHRRRVVGIEQTDANVTASFADGSTVVVDILIGAGGVSSMLRSIVFPEAKPPGRFASAYVGVLDIGKKKGLPDAPPIIFDPPMAVYMYPLKGNCIFTRFVNEWGAPKHVVDLVRVADRITPIFMWDLPDMPTQHKGRVLLIGDAGHATLPSLGQGLAMGIKDCGVLHDLMTLLPDSNHAVLFKLYEKIQLPRLLSIAAKSREIARYQTASSRIEMWFGRNQFGLKDSVTGYIYEHDVARVMERYKQNADISSAA